MTLTRLGRITEYTGFGDGKGNISFNKLVTFTALWAFIAMAMLTIRELRQVPTIAMLSFGLACIAAGFGLKGLMAYFATRRETVLSESRVTAHTDVAASIRAALEARNASEGYQPAGKVRQEYPAHGE